MYIKLQCKHVCIYSELIQKWFARAVLDASNSNSNRADQSYNHHMHRHHRIITYGVDGTFENGELSALQSGRADEEVTNHANGIFLVSVYESGYRWAFRYMRERYRCTVQKSWNSIWWLRIRLTDTASLYVCEFACTEQVVLHLWNKVVYMWLKNVSVLVKVVQLRSIDVGLKNLELAVSVIWIFVRERMHSLNWSRHRVRTWTQVTMRVWFGIERT